MRCPSACVLQEGKPRQECYTPEVLAAIQADNWNFAAPGGESQRQLEERVVSSCSAGDQWWKAGRHRVGTFPWKLHGHSESDHSLMQSTCPVPCQLTMQLKFIEHCECLAVSTCTAVTPGMAAPCGAWQALLLRSICYH
jgi:hypothetical protein